MTYTNGFLPSSALYVVQGIKGTKSARVANKVTAHDYKAFKKAASRVGIDLVIPIYGDYRSFLIQDGLKRNPEAFGSHLPSDAIASAGHSSHGYGYNLDVYASINATGRRKKLTQERAWSWVKNNMGKYGFSQRDAVHDPHCLMHKG